MYSKISIAGVFAGKSAGMKVVALTTTHTAEEFKNADLIIKDYTEINFNRLMSLQHEEADSSVRNNQYSIN
ncbi:MAG: hypothetical protein WKG06_33775 [Segetibacter sp.]